MTDDIEREVLRSGRPDPPPELRRRVLAMANPLVQPHGSRLDAIWFSRRWRLAAALVSLGLIAADGWSSVTGGLSPQVDGLPVHSSVQVAVQAAIDAGLGEADVAAIAAQVTSPTLGTEVETTRGGRMGLTGVP